MFLLQLVSSLVDNQSKIAATRCEEGTMDGDKTVKEDKTYTMNSSGILRVDVKKLVRSKKFRRALRAAKLVVSQSLVK
jgi:hypothetical protein